MERGKNMKLSVEILVLLAIGCIAIAEGCHHGTGRRKRSAHNPTAPRVDEKLAKFFEKCLSGPASGIFDSLRSVVDTVIRDSVWYKDVKAGICTDDKDVAECWIYTLPFLLDIDSSLYEPTAQCICDWSKKCWDPPNGINKTQAPDSIQRVYTYKLRPTRPPPLSRELKQFSSCTYENRKKFLRPYPSLRKFNGGSNSIFFRDHYTYCRSIPKFPYEQRNLFVLLYVKRVCPKTGSKSTWRKDVINVYRKATRKDGPMSSVVDTCDSNSKPDVCQPNPCKNGGKCTEVRNGYRCVCDIKFSGEHCENVLRCYPPDIKYGGVANEKKYYNAREWVMYYCDEGYTASVGAGQCTRDRKWSPVAICKPVTKNCKGHKIPYGKVDPDKPLYGAGATVEYSCQRGYTLDGKDENKCLPTGNWRYEFPTCKKNPNCRCNEWCEYTGNCCPDFAKTCATDYVPYYVLK